MSIIQKILAITFTISFIGGIGIIIIPLFAISLGASSVHLGLVGAFSSGFYALSCYLLIRFKNFLDYYHRIFLALLLKTSVYFLFPYSHALVVLIVCIMFDGILYAFFWTSIQSLLGRYSKPEELNQNLVKYNFRWTLGFMLGTFVGSVVAHLSIHIIYFTLAFLAGITLLYFYFFMPHEKEKSLPRPNQNNQKEQTIMQTVSGFMLLILCINLIIFSLVGNLTMVFPKFALFLGYTKHESSFLQFVIRLLQFFTFFLMSRSRYSKEAPPLNLLVALILLMSLLLIGAGYIQNFYLFTLAFAVLGITASITYQLSLYYSILHRGNSELHETFIGTGMFFGPLIGGILADYFSLPMPFYFYAVVLLILSFWIASKNKKRVLSSSENLTV